MEAALRTAYEFITKEKAPDILYDLKPVRGMEGVKEASLISVISQSTWPWFTVREMPEK